MIARHLTGAGSRNHTTQNPGTQQRTRRLRTALAAATIAGTMLLTIGCSANGGAADELTWTIAGDNLSAGHMDPHKSQLDVSAYVARASLDSLVFLDAEGVMHPWLAETWETSEDGKTVTFELREDVTFSDGTPFNAEAVRANFAHIMAEETVSAQAASLLGGEFYSDTVVNDEYSVSVVFSEPFAPFLNNASTAFLGMYSPAVLTEHQDDLAVGGPGITVGSGPYVMTELVPNDHITYERNPEYQWAPEGAEVPEEPVETLTIDLVPESSVRAQAMNSGAAQLATGFAPSDLEALNSDLEVTQVPSPGIPRSLYLNVTRPLITEQPVREAVRRALDIDSAVSATYFDTFDRAWSILSPTTVGAYDPSLEGSWPQDQALANRLLDDAGWQERDEDGIRVRDGERLSLVWLSWTPVSAEQTSLAALFAQDLAQVGVELEHQVVEPGEYNERYATGDFDMTDWSFASVDGDALRNHLHSDGFQNASFVRDAALDAVLEEAASSSDQAVRERGYQQVQQWNDAQVAIIPVVTPALLGAVGPSVKGLVTDVYGWPLLSGVSLSGA